MLKEFRNRALCLFISEYRLGLIGHFFPSAILSILTTLLYKNRLNRTYTVFITTQMDLLGNL